MGLFTEYLPIPAPLALLAIAAEFFGDLGLILGFLTRIAAVGIATRKDRRADRGTPVRGCGSSAPGTEPVTNR